MIETIFLTIYVIGAVIVFFGQLQNGFLIALITAAIWPVASLILTIWLFFKTYKMEKKSNVDEKEATSLFEHLYSEKDSNGADDDQEASNSEYGSVTNQNNIYGIEKLHSWLGYYGSACYDADENLIGSLDEFATALQRDNIAKLVMDHLELDYEENIPSELFELRNQPALKSIEIAGSFSQEFFNKICDFDNITDLSLYFGKPVQDLSAVSNLDKLKQLSITGDLESIPKEIFNLSALEDLYISIDKLEDIQPEIQNLQSLKRLQITGTLVKKLPDEVIKLQDLKILDITDNDELGLSQSQEEWIKTLEKNGCEVSVGTSDLRFIFGD